MLFLTIDFPPMGGGMARHSYDLVKAMRHIGKPPLVLTPRREGGREFDKKIDIKIIRLKGITIEKLFEHYLWSTTVFFGYAFYYCITQRVNAIFVNTWSIVGVAAFLVKRIWGVPYFVFAHGLDVYAPQNNKKVATLMRLVLRNASLVIANSHFTKELVETMVNTKAMVLHPVVDIERFARKGDSHKLFEGRKVLLTVGRLVESKGHDAVIRSLKKVVEKFPGILYCIVGAGPGEESFKNLVSELALADNVIFSGKVDDEELSSYFHSCNVFIMTSKEIKERGEVEGFGIVFLEAGACGKPVIGSKSGGIPDAVIDGVTGILVDPLDIEGIADAIIRLLSNENLAARLGENGRKRVETESNINGLGERLKEIVNGGTDITT